jgi:hypothetical protein
MNFLNLALLAGAAMAACPVNNLLSNAKMLTGNIINAMNQKNLGLLIGAIASDDAVALGKAFDPAQGHCIDIPQQPYPQFVGNAIASNIKFVQANITDAFQTTVGYTVVQVHALDDRNQYSTHQFNFMDPEGTCNLRLIMWSVDEDRCLVHA